MSISFKEKAKKETKGMIVAIFVAILIRTFFFQPFVIPSGSMYPTLMIGDFLFSSKYPYGYSSKSFLFGIPKFEGRIMQKDAKVGEIVIFNNPKMPEMDFVKRCVGAPGDTVQVRGGYLYLNGKKCELEFVDMYTYTDQYGRIEVAKRYKETMPNGVVHYILKRDAFGEGSHDNTEEFKVPSGHYFMMGDNRDNSQDSRFFDKVGYVPEASLIGRAEILFFSTEARLYKHAESKWYDVSDLQIDPVSWITGIRWSRLLHFVR